MAASKDHKQQERSIETVLSERCVREVLLASCGAVEHLRTEGFDQSNKGWGKFSAILEDVDFSMQYELAKRGNITIMSLPAGLTVRDSQVIDQKSYKRTHHNQHTKSFNRLAAHVKHAVIEASLGYGATNSIAMVIEDKPDSVPIIRYAKYLGYRANRLPDGRRFQITDPKQNSKLLRLEDLQ